MSYRGLRDNSEQVFFPLFEHDDTGATFYIKVRGAPEQAIPSIRHLVRQDDPRLPILWFRTLDDRSTAPSTPSACWPRSPAASAPWRCCFR